MSLTVIELENMEFQAFHGCYELERQVGNRFLVSVRIEAELGEARRQRSDRADDQLPRRIRDRPRAQMDIPSHILEHVAGRIAGRIRERFSAKRPGSGQGLENGPSSGRENRESLGNSRKIKGGERVLITS